MDSIRQSMDRLSDLSSEELTALQEKIVAEFGTLSDSVGDNPTPEAVDAMMELADASDALKAESELRVAEAAELSAKAEEAISRMSASEASAEVEAGEATDVAETAEGEETGAEEELSAADDKEDEEEEAPVADEAPADESDADEAPESDEDEEKKKKDLKPFASETETAAEAVVDAPAEAEASIAEAPEAEAAVEEAPEAESATETPLETVAELATEDSNTESSEEPVTASNTPNGELAFEAPEELRPAATKAKAPVVITAGGDLPGITAGSELASFSDVAQALLTRHKGMGRTSGGNGEHLTVATFTTTFPEDRSLKANDVEGNRAKVNSVVAPEAIVAAGGLTAPVDTSYDIFELGETSVRPVKEALAVFGADKGGLRFMTPPVLADLEGSASLWTMEDDINAATEGAPDPVKPSIRVAAGVEITVYTDAIPVILTFGNLAARAYPELVERHTQLAVVNQARFAETRLLTRIGALSTQVTAGAELGAARDIFIQLEQAAAAYRSRYRLNPEAPLRVIFPEWFKNALRSDLTKQIPGDGRDGTFNLGDAEINKWFTTRHINVSWHIDGEAGQIFGAQNDGALLGFPSEVIWYLFSEGTFLFLDGGTLELGLVRDSTLNGTNDYQMFVETFEGVAKVGVESLRVKSTLKIKGSASSTTVVAG